MDQIPVYALKYYALGHSYLRHGPFKGWTWPDPENGNRGMAASSADKDYFARFQYYLKENFACRIDSFAENIAKYERLCVDGMTAQMYQNHELYHALAENLKAFAPNLVTVFVGGGNTVANDYANIYLFYNVLFDLVRKTVGEDTIVIAVNRSKMDTDVGRACQECAEKHQFACCDVSFLREPAMPRENPYYAFSQYPEYDDYIAQYKKENGGTAPVEFRTHPGDVGMDAIGKAIYVVAAPLIADRIAPEWMHADVWKALVKKEEKQVEDCKRVQSKMDSVCTKARFDFDGDDSEGVLFNGFNVYLKNSFLCGNSAPGTGFSITHDHLQLDGSRYRSFAVKLNVQANSIRKESANLQVKLHTENDIYAYMAELVVNALQEYRFDISEISGSITGFEIAPSIIECNADVDWIAFE